MMSSFRIIVLMILVVSIKATSQRKLDDTTPGSPNDEIKCGSCPCGTTCYASPPPPTPSPPPPSPPPPPPKKTPTPGSNCPPPPYGGGGGGGGGGGHAPPNYIYITGPPGDLYPVVQSISAASRVTLPFLVTSGFLGMGMLAFW